MNKKLKKNLTRILVATVLFITALLVEKEPYKTLLFLSAYLLVGYDVLYKALRNIGHGQVLDEYFLMALATVGALALKDTSEATAVMLFYQVGEWFQSYASEQSRKSISSLMDIRPDFARIQKNGEWVKVDPEEVEVNTLIQIQPGERIPLDGIIEEGHSYLDTSSLTGESLPREVSKGDEVFSGCINQSGVITVVTAKEFEESTVSKILELVENSASKKSQSEQFISKFSRYYTPIVVGLAVLLAVLPPLFIGMNDLSVWKDYIYRSLNFLVISCPCALVLSVPLSFFSGLGAAGKAGVLVKGSNYLEALSKVSTLASDKTGTLTKGVFKVKEVLHDESLNEKELLMLAARAESHSSHPIAKALKEAVGDLGDYNVEDVTETAGKGVSLTMDGQQIMVGNAKWFNEENIVIPSYDQTGTLVYVAIDKHYVGLIVIDDEVKENMCQTLKDLRKEGIKKMVLLTGDNDKTAKAIASSLGVDEVYSHLLPQDKVTVVESLIKTQNPSEKTAFIGDGINDAPVLMLADVGIAMGALGSDAAIEAADVVLMDDDLNKIVNVLHISRKTLQIVKENIIFAIGAKVLILILSALNITGLDAAIFADVGVAVICVLNAMRVLKYKG